MRDWAHNSEMGHLRDNEQKQQWQLTLRSYLSLPLPALWQQENTLQIFFRANFFFATSLLGSSLTFSLANGKTNAWVAGEEGPERRERRKECGEISLLTLQRRSTNSHANLLEASASFSSLQITLRANFLVRLPFRRRIVEHCMRNCRGTNTFEAMFVFALTRCPKGVANSSIPCYFCHAEWTLSIPPSSSYRLLGSLWCQCGLNGVYTILIMQPQILWNDVCVHWVKNGGRETHFLSCSLRVSLRSSGFFLCGGSGLLSSPPFWLCLEEFGSFLNNSCEYLSKFPRLYQSHLNMCAYWSCRKPHSRFRCCEKKELLKSMQWKRNNRVWKILQHLQDFLVLVSWAEITTELLLQ